MGEEAEDKPVVGEQYKGSLVVNIDEERSTRPNGVIRIRKSIQLDSGMILMEDEFQDKRKIEGEYKELRYDEIPSPTGIKLSVGHEKKKKKKPKAPDLSSEDDARREAEAKAKIAADEAGRKAKAANELKEARELAMKLEAEKLAEEKAEEKARQEEEEQRLRQEEEQRRMEEEQRLHKEEEKRRMEEESRLKEEKARLEAERLQKERDDERLRASQEAARRRKKQADRRREEERKKKEEQRRRQAIIDSWEPEIMLAVSPESIIRPTNGGMTGIQTQAIWMYSPGHVPDEDFDWWKPQGVIVHPPGKQIAPPNSDQPCGFWAYAPGGEPSDDGEWRPQGGSIEPKIFLFPPGVQPSAHDKDLKVQGEWTYPEGETCFPPLPVPKNEWDPKCIKVLPESHSPKRPIADNVIHGQWMVYDGDRSMPMGEEDWRVAEIQVYPEGKEPRDFSQVKNHGVWGLAPEARPNEDGEWKAEDLWFFGPGNTPPDDEKWSPQGVWTHSLGSGRDDWPPVSEPQDEWEAQQVWVCPPNQIPPPEDEEWKPTGVWNFGDGPMGEAEDWMPYQVTIYPKGQEPENLDECKVHGVWGLSPGAERDEDGNWKASDLWFVGPGEKPPEDWRPQGVWTVSPESGEQDEAWPPKRSDISTKATEPEMVCVYPPSKVPAPSSKKSSQGVWTFGNGADDDDDEPDWTPQNVMLYPAGTEPDDLDSCDAHGIYGFAPGAEANADGKYDPSDMWFFMPGEEPDDDDWYPTGTWAIPSGQSSIQFQFPKPKGKTRVEPPKKVWVFPKKKVPKQIEKGVAKGVWSYTPGKKVMDAGKKPIQVDLFVKGQEPTELPSRHGVWGYAPGAQPDEHGEYLPEDMWLFAPGETPPGDEKWQPRGVWSELPPPPKKKETSKKSKSPEKKARKDPNELRRKFEKSAWVYASKDRAPGKGEKKNPQGCWSKLPGGSEDDGPWEMLYYTKGHEPSDIEKLPHGAWGYAPGSQPDERGVWSPKDMLFFPPGEDPPPDVQQQGTWTYPHGSRIEITTNYRYEGDDIIYMKTTEIYYMDTVISFTKEWRKD